MAAAPQISIGMPVYNGERFVAPAIEAILAQTYTNFELIISDNGSTDATPAICRRYAASDGRIKLHLSPQNRGGAWNFQHVFHLSQGRFFRWAAYDDLCTPDHLAACLAPLEAYPAVVLCYPRTLVIDEDGRPVREYHDDLDLREPSPIRRYRHYQEHYRHGAACNPIYGLIRRDVLRQTQIMGDYVSSDIVLLGELALHGQFYEVPERLFLRRDHPQTVLRTYGSLGEGITWYDPGRRRARHPVLRLLAEHLGVVRRAPLPWHNRLVCLTLVGRWFGWQLQDHLARLAQRGGVPDRMSL